MPGLYETIKHQTIPDNHSKNKDILLEFQEL